MARDRSRGRKNHVHREGVRCSRCRPLSKTEVARIAPPPPEKPQQPATVTEIQGMAQRIRMAGLASLALKRQPTPKSGERGQRRVQAK